MTSDRPSQPITRPGRSTGMKSSEFISATQTNTVSASGAMKVRCRGSSTSIDLRPSRPASRSRTGNDPARRTSPCGLPDARMAIVARPQTIDQNSVSRFQTWMSKIDVWCAVEKFCKWCAMYSDGSIARVPSLAAISLMPPKLSKIVSGRSRRNCCIAGTRRRAGSCHIRTPYLPSAARQPEFCAATLLLRP